MKKKDTDILPQIELETHSFLIKVLRIVSVPVMNMIPASMLKGVMKKTSKDAGTVVDKGGSTHALEAMYTRYNRGIFSRGIVQGIADLFWHHAISQPKALRNRLKLVKEVLSHKTSELIATKEAVSKNAPIAILSIAGGSARSIIGTISNLRKNGATNPISVVVIDKDKLALEVGQKVAESEGVADSFTWINGNAREIDTLMPGMKFDIVEIVGLLDYFDKERATRLLTMSSELMNTGGSIIIANVLPNSEMKFVHKTGWPMMIYRKEKDMLELLEGAGFNKKNDIIIEPLKVHIVAVAQK